MREILFRGKRIEDGEWVEGYVAIHTIIGEETELKTVIVQKPDKIYQYDSWIVDPETVGQYTGLKDKNGKRIFEGDIHEYDGHHFPVKFGYYTDDDTHVEMYGWYLDSNSLEEQGSLGVDSEKYVNIIGNIHEEVIENE